jgi:hypothetical protein
MEMASVFILGLGTGPSGPGTSLSMNNRRHKNCSPTGYLKHILKPFQLTKNTWIVSLHLMVA